MTAPAMPDSLTGLAAESWELWAPIIWANGHLTDDTRETIIRGCLDWAVYSAHVRSKVQGGDTDNPEAHAAFLRTIDFQNNYGLTPMGRLAMENRGGTIGDRVTPPEDDDPELTAEFIAELQRATFMKIHEGDEV